MRLPKALGLSDGDEMLLREDAGKFVFEPIPIARKTIDLTGIYGSIPDMKLLTDEDRIMEPRDLDWGGALLNRD